MALDIILTALSILAILSGTALFLQKKLLHSVVFLSLAAGASALMFIYLGQVLVALLQLLVFVGGLSTYLFVAVAAEERGVRLRNAAFLIASLVIAIGLLAVVSNAQVAETSGGNDFSSIAQTALSKYYALMFASVFMLFAVAIGSVVVIKRFSKLVV